MIPPHQEIGFVNYLEALAEVLKTFLGPSWKCLSKLKLVELNGDRMQRESVEDALFFQESKFEKKL